MNNNGYDRYYGLIYAVVLGGMWFLHYAPAEKGAEEGTGNAGIPWKLEIQH